MKFFSPGLQGNPGLRVTPYIFNPEGVTLIVLPSALITQIARFYSPLRVASHPWAIDYTMYFNPEGVILIILLSALIT
jgi:hypothetical protein